MCKGTEVCPSFRSRSRRGGLGLGDEVLLAMLRSMDLLQRAMEALKGLQLESDLLRFVVLHHLGGRREAALGAGEGWKLEAGGRHLPLRPTLKFKT